MAATRTNRPNKTTARRDIRRTWKYVCLHPRDAYGRKSRTMLGSTEYGLGLAKTGSEWFPIMRLANLKALKEKYNARLPNHPAQAQIDAS